MPGAPYLASFPGNTDAVGFRKESATTTMPDQYLIWGPTGKCGSPSSEKPHFTAHGNHPKMQRSTGRGESGPSRYSYITAASGLREHRGRKGRKQVN